MPLHRLYECGRAILCVPSPWRGIWGTRVWGCRHKAAVSARAQRLQGGQSSISGPNLRSRLPPCGWSQGCDAAVGGGAALLSSAEQNRGGHRGGPWGARPAGMDAGVRHSLQQVVGRCLEAGLPPGFGACHSFTSESRCAPPLTLYFRLRLVVDMDTLRITCFQ